jgi:hypothetical protein
MKLYKNLLRWYLNKQGMRVAIELAAAMREYKTRLALHGKSAYIYADVLAPMAGRVESLTVELEFINAKRDRIKATTGLPVIEPDLLDTSKEAGK